MSIDPSGSPDAGGSVPRERGRRFVSGLTAAGSVFVLPIAVDAGVVYSGLQNLSVSLPVGQRPASSMVSGSNVAPLLVDVDGDLNDDFQFLLAQTKGSTAAFGLAVGFGASAGFVLDPAGTTARPLFARFSLGQTIGYPSGLWGTGGFARFVLESTSRVESGLTPGVPAYLGMAFVGSGGIHSGWLRLVVEEGPQGFPVSMTIMDWAWNEDPLGAIRAGEVPEANPALAMLAAAGTGFAAWRLGRRKRMAGTEG